ncbi:MAG: tetratricopeptide repeat protein, partial [Pseudomonadota bacterium]
MNGMRRGMNGCPPEAGMGRAGAAWRSLYGAAALGAAIFLTAALPPAPAMADRLSGLVDDCSGLKASPRDLLRLCEEALKADDGRLGSEGRAAVHYNAGVAALDMGRAVQAEGHFDEAVTLAPRMAAAWVSRGLALAAQGKVSDAASSYGQAIAVDPSAAGPYLARARLQAEAGSFDAAVVDYTAAIERAPDWEASYFE